jgi:hypothetical protein
MKPCGHTIIVSVLLLCAVSAGQAVKRDAPPYPPEPADKSITTDQQQRSGIRPHVDKLQIQREAQEISDLAGTLQADIDHVNQGTLPKDVIEKLKKIEKLARHLRGEIAP